MSKASKAATKNTPPEGTPTPAEAKAMLAERPAMSSVLTTEGRMYRDGRIDESDTGPDA